MFRGILELNRNVTNELLFSIERYIDQNKEMIRDINRTLKFLEKPIYKEERKR